jgi:hypothetical protein
MSFEETIALTQTWLREVAQGTVPDAEILTHLREVFQSTEGVRGFFVVFLTTDLLGETCPEAILQAFVENGPHIAAILVKNLAMSTAMILHHDRQGDDPQKAGSIQVQQRSARLLAILEQRGALAFAQERSALLASLETGTGSYGTFLDRWGYDSEQRQAIQAALKSIKEFKLDLRSESRSDHPD